MYTSIDELFHVASRNAEALKTLRSGHLVHYSPDIERIVDSAPLRTATMDAHDILSAPCLALPLPLDTALLRRRSDRDYGGGAITFTELATVCYSATGVKEVSNGPNGLSYRRNAASSGGMGSIEAFPISLKVDGLPAGLYHYDSVSQTFGLLQHGNFEDWLRADVLYQVEFSTAAAVIVLVGNFVNMRAKYGIRGYRSTLIDAGHVSQNIYLAATALNLNVCATTGFIDDELDEALGLDGVDRASLLVLLIGRATPY